TLGSAAAAIALYAGSYERLSQRALEGAPPQGSASLFAGAARNRRFARAVRRPLSAAVRSFTIRTLVRSRTHRMMFAVYAGFALALIMSSALSIAFRNRGAGFWEPGLAMMSMPLIAQFLLLVAVRVIVAIPSEPKARWVFR